MEDKKLFGMIGILLIITIGALSVINFLDDDPIIKPVIKIDDWKYDPGKDGVGGIFNVGIPQVLTKSFAEASISSVPSDSLGFSTGGAKDINNFRENIENNYLPLFTDITYEGLYYDYFFDTGAKEKCDELFCPSYSYSVSKDPISGENEYYMAVGLNSGIKESDFERKKLNLVVVLDISGSMSSSFDRYYYDQFGNRIENEGFDSRDASKTKMKVASEAVVDLIGHLNDDDRFGVVLFDDSAYLAKPMNLVSETNLGEIKDHILELAPRGGTHMSAGMKLGTDQYKKLFVDSDEYENRIIFLTDAMPNIGDISETGLLGITKKNAEKKLFTTFIGIGIDFNTELIESISKIKGSNYYSVHSSKEFKERMDEGFEFMVTPLVFDLNLKLEGSGFEIEKVYGSPEANEATGELMKVNTLFPSKSEDGETKGGIVLLKLKRVSDDGDLKLIVSYENRNGEKFSNSKEVEILNKDEYFENKGIRKSILLARYANLIKNWINDERSEVIFEPSVDKIVGIDIPVPPFNRQLSRWERQSTQLTVSESYNKLFEEFRIYFEQEMGEIGDSSLQQEVDILKKLENY
tara:strand:+ start:24379 stop:26115 length:1737 start_codon:yes stop_codon:yes gene_type:complete